MIIHFVCRGNVHRSLMAEAYVKSLKLPDVEVRSSGTVAEKFREENTAIFRRLKELLVEHGLGEFTKQRSDQLTQTRIDGVDVTVLMNAIVKTEAEKIVTLPENVIVWDITDAGEGKRIILPGEDELKYAEEVFAELKLNIHALLNELRLLS
jgi:protein-tyrosine-phosphatase